MKHKRTLVYKTENKRKRKLKHHSLDSDSEKKLDESHEVSDANNKTMKKKNSKSLSRAEKINLVESSKKEGATVQSNDFSGKKFTPDVEEEKKKKMEEKYDSSEESDLLKRQRIISKETIGSKDDEEGTSDSNQSRVKNSEEVDEEAFSEQNANVREKEVTETSDTSIDDDSKTKIPPKKKKRNDCLTENKKDSSSSTLIRMKRLATLAGFRFCYKKLFCGIESDKKKADILKKELIEKGLKTFSVKACKEFRLQKEQEKELAELDLNEIIGPQSSKCVTRSCRMIETRGKIKRSARLSSSSFEEDSEAEKVVEENKEIFSRLKGIVSDESD